VFWCLSVTWGKGTVDNCQIFSSVFVIIHSGEPQEIPRGREQRMWTRPTSHLEARLAGKTQVRHGSVTRLYSRSSAMSRERLEDTEADLLRRPRSPFYAMHRLRLDNRCDRTGVHGSPVSMFSFFFKIHLTYRMSGDKLQSFVCKLPKKCKKNLGLEGA
jgi:hypothetical protein